MSGEQEKCRSLPGCPMPLTEPCQGLCLAFSMCWVQTAGTGSESSDQLMVAGITVSVLPFPGDKQALGMGVRVSGQPSAPSSPPRPKDLALPHSVFQKERQLFLGSYLTVVISLKQELGAVWSLLGLVIIVITVADIY